jgi:hypothetical protein
MRKGKIFFHPVDGSAPLTISWSTEPKGDAVEAKKGDGVGFFSEQGALLCVIFDEVQSPKDHQALEFTHERIEVSVKNGQVTYSISRKKDMHPKKRKPTRKKTAKKNI